MYVSPSCSPSGASSIRDCLSKPARSPRTDRGISAAGSQEPSRSRTVICWVTRVLRAGIGSTFGSTEPAARNSSSGSHVIPSNRDIAAQLMRTGRSAATSSSGTSVSVAHSEIIPSGLSASECFRGGTNKARGSYGSVR